MRFSILGAGHGANVYLPALKQLGHEVVVLAARTPKPGLQIEQTADWRAAMARPDIDAVVITFPPPLQREAVLAAAALGKPFLCEKPAGMNSRDTEAMLAAAQDSGLPHAIGFQFRYEPAIAEMKKSIDEGALGVVERIEVDWCAGGAQSRLRPWSWRNDAALGGGVELNFATHTLDYLQWFLGPATLAGRNAQICVRERSHDGQAKPVTAPDACDFLLRFGTATASVRITNVALQPSGHRIVARGTLGALEFWHRPPFRDTDLSLTMTEAGGQSWTRSGAELGMAAGFPDSRIGPTCGLLADFAAGVAGQQRSRMPTLSDALSIQRLLA
jgi:predicted dehydrogenase